MGKQNLSFKELLEELFKELLNKLKLEFAFRSKKLISLLI